MVKPRIIGGKYKGKKLEIPDYEVRPITDRTKRSLFDTLKPVIQGAKCLDLFCGSGTIGIEALSRGAEHVDFVDVSPQSIKLLKQNLRALEVSNGKFSVYKYRFDAYLERFKDNEYDIIFVDPPFLLFNDIDFGVLRMGMNLETLTMIKISKQKYYDIIENISELFEVVHQKKVGINNLVYIKLKTSPKFRTT